MKHFDQLAAIMVVVVVLGTFSVAQSSHSGYEPTTPSRPVKPRDSFVDFTLKLMNPSDRDYGECLSESRTILVEGTLRDTYFWSNLIALGVLGCLFFVVLYQHNVHAKRQWAVAEIIGQLEQNLARSRAQLADATKKNREFADALAARKDSASRSPSLALESTNSPVEAMARPSMPDKQAAPPAAAVTNSRLQNASAAPRTSGGKESTTQMRLFTPDADFVMRVNSLEQQLAQSREDNRQLRRRIADGDRKPETEQERRHQLKGA